MKRIIRHSLSLLLFAAAVFMLVLLPANVSKAYDPLYNLDDPDVDKVNPDTGYRLVIYDGADLLSSSEIKDLAQQMGSITNYGHVALVTTDETKYSSTSTYAEEIYDEMFGYDSGTVFVIDMDNRYLWIHSDGDVLKVITKSYAEDITDNAYRYASDGDYYACCSKVFSQMSTVLGGQKIARPMRYVSNALLALLLSFLINFMIVRNGSKIQNTSSAEMLSGASKSLRYTPPAVIKTGETKTYSPQSSGSSGGGGGHRSGGGGGGHHGGGGGHRF